MKDTGLTKKEWEQIRAALRAVPAIEKAVLFGSRAMGLARGNSDVDIMLYGDALTMGDVAHARALLEETTLPYQFDLVLCDAENAALQEHVRRNGKSIYPLRLCVVKTCELKNNTLGSLAHISTGRLDSNAACINGKYPFFTCSPQTLSIDNYAFDTEAVILSGNNANGIFTTKYYKGMFNAYQRTYVIEPINNKEIDCMFLYFYISVLLEKLGELSIGSATKFLTKKILNNLQIYYPDLHSQKDIASILSAFDDRIQLLRETNTTLEAMAQALFKSWFVDFDPVHAKAEGRTPEGMDVETAGLFPAEFEESALGMIPKGWQVAPIGEHVTIVGGGTPSTKNPDYWAPEEHAWTSPKDLSGLLSPVLLSTEKKISSAGLAGVSSGLLPEGTLLLSSRAPIGYLAIAKIPLAINQGYIAVPPDSELPPIFMYFWCKLNMEIIKGHANGSTFMEISKKAFRLIPSIIPDRSVVSACLSILQVLFGRITSNEEQARTLTALRDALLPRLISGKLRLPEFAESTNEAEI